MVEYLRSFTGACVWATLGQNSLRKFPCGSDGPFRASVRTWGPRLAPVGRIDCKKDLLDKPVRKEEPLPPDHPPQSPVPAKADGDTAATLSPAFFNSVLREGCRVDACSQGRRQDISLDWRCPNQVGPLQEGPEAGCSGWREPTGGLDSGNGLLCSHSSWRVSPRSRYQKIFLCVFKKKF